MISQNYYASQFCLAELGATWALSHKIIPLLIPPLKYDDLKAVLTSVQATKIESADDWNQAMEVISQALDLKPNFARWENKRDQFLKALPPLIDAQPKPPTVAMQKFEEVKKHYDDAKVLIDEQQQELKHLQKLLEEVKAAKNADEVREIELSSLSEQKQLESLVHRVGKATDEFPKPVKEALYFFFRSEAMLWPDAFGNSDAIAEIRDALERKLIWDSNDTLLPNEDHPKVRAAIKVLKDLESLLENASSEFSDAYEDNYDEPLSFESRDFWQRFIF